MMPSSKRPRGVFAKALAAAVLSSVIAVSCWHPVFDWMLSESEITVRKLGEPTLYFTADTYESYGLENAWFLPQMMNTPTAGLLVLDMGSRIRFKSVSAIDPLNHYGWVDQMSGFETNNTMGSAYLVQAYPDGTSNALIAANPADGRTITMPPPITTINNITLPAPASPAQFAIGSVSVFTVNQASIAAFAYDGTNPRYQIVNAWDGGDPGFAPAPAAITFSAGSQVAAPGKFLAAPAWLYLSCGMSDGSRAIFRWVNPPAASEPVRFPEDYGPLIGALSDGHLLAQKDGIISVLDPDLNFLFKFPAGKLRFVHERYDSLIDFEMKVVFTRTVFVRNNSHDSHGQILVEVFKIPTAELERLAD
jgi:hypothetical protein